MTRVIFVFLRKFCVRNTKKLLYSNYFQQKSKFYWTTTRCRELPPRCATIKSRSSLTAPHKSFANEVCFSRAPVLPSGIFFIGRKLDRNYWSAVSEALGIIGSQFKPLSSILMRCTVDLRGAFIWSPITARGASVAIGCTYTPDCLMNSRQTVLSLHGRFIYDGSLLLITFVARIRIFSESTKKL